jgi:hypothetical protein
MAAVVRVHCYYSFTILTHYFALVCSRITVHPSLHPPGTQVVFKPLQTRTNLKAAIWVHVLDIFSKGRFRLYEGYCLGANNVISLLRNREPVEVLAFIALFNLRSIEVTRKAPPE